MISQNIHFTKVILVTNENLMHQVYIAQPDTLFRAERPLHEANRKHPVYFIHYKIKNNMGSMITSLKKLKFVGQMIQPFDRK